MIRIGKVGGCILFLAVLLIPASVFAGPNVKNVNVVNTTPIPVAGNVTIGNDTPISVSGIVGCYLVEPPSGSTCGIQKPVVSVVGLASTPVVGTPVVLSVTASDPDNLAPCNLDQVITVRSEFINMPSMATATLTPAVGYSPTFVPNVAGSYTILVRATDDTGRSSSAQITVDVAPL